MGTVFILALDRQTMAIVACHECEKSQKVVGVCVRCGGFCCEQCVRWCRDCQRMICIGCGDVHLKDCSTETNIADHSYNYCGSELCR